MYGLSLMQADGGSICRLSRPTTSLVYEMPARRASRLEAKVRSMMALIRHRVSLRFEAYGAGTLLQRLGRDRVV